MARPPAFSTPVPIEAVPNPAPFPVEVLPGWFGTAVEAAAEAFQVPTEFPALMGLAVASAATAGRVFVSARADWTEPCVLHTVTGLPSGSLKSPVTKLLRKPLDQVQADLQAEAAERLPELRTERAVLEAIIRRARDTAVKADNPDERKAAIETAVQAERDLAKLPPAYLPRLTTTDASPEELQRLLSKHGGRLAVIHDEAGVFDIMEGRFGPLTNLDPWLVGHDGGRLESDRKGKDGRGDNTTVEEAYVTMGMAVQPSVLESLGKSGRLQGRGITARFLYALPRVQPGSRNLVDSTPVPTQVRREYTDHMARLHRCLLDRSDGPFPEPLTLHLAPDALEDLHQFQMRCERAQGPGGSLEHMTSWASKLPGQLLRIAGILHLLSHPSERWPDPIERTTILNCVRIAECLVDHARAVHDILGEDGTHADARLVHTWLRNHPVETISLRDVYRNVKSLSGPKRAREAIALLVEYGWLAPPISDDEDHDRRPGRPPSPTWYVHPILRARPTDGDLVDLFEAA